MNPTEKFRLIQDIYFSLETIHKTEEIIDILNSYGIESNPAKNYTSKSLKKLLQHADDDKILRIGNDLNLMTTFTKKTKNNNIPQKKPSFLSKIFISHSHKDKEIASLFVQVLQVIGIDSKAIYCSSLEGYGTDLGTNFINDIKTELSKEVLVFPVLSDNFYASPMSLMELGAVWGQTKDLISVIIPPFEFKQITGVLQHIQGIEINNEKHLDLLKERIETLFDIEPKRTLVWNPMRDILLLQINQILRTHGKNNS